MTSCDVETRFSWVYLLFFRFDQTDILYYHEHCIFDAFGIDVRTMT